MGLVIAAMAGLLSQGCPATTPDDGLCPAPGPDGVSVDDYCDEFARILCEGYDECCAIDDLDACIDRIHDECEAGEISSIRAGNACLDPVVARSCLDAWRDSFLDCQRNEPIGAACRYQWYGRATVGESCRDVWWCEQGLGCIIEGTGGVCEELPVLGESCAVTATCGPGGLYCSYEDWTCHAVPGLDESCEREGICAAGSCIEGTCQATSWCG